MRHPESASQAVAPRTKTILPALSAALIIVVGALWSGCSRQSEPGPEGIAQVESPLERGLNHQQKRLEGSHGRAAAESRFDGAVELKPNDSRGLQRGTAHSSVGEYDRTIAYYTRFGCQTTTSSNCYDFYPLISSYYERGVEHYDSGDFARAIADFSRAVVLNRLNVLIELYYYRGRSYYEKKLYEQALADFERVIVYYRSSQSARLIKPLRPADMYSETHRYRELSYSKVGVFDSGIAEYDASVKIAPSDAGSYYERGAAYYAKGEHGKAILLTPDVAHYYHMRAMAYHDIGEYGSAIADFSKVITLDPDYEAAHYDRGIAHYEAGAQPAFCPDTASCAPDW